MWKKKIAVALSMAFLASSLTFGSTASAYIIDVGMADLAAKEKAEKDKKEAAQKAEQEKIAREKAAKEKVVREKAEKERKAAEKKAAQEKAAREKKEAKEKIARERVAKEQKAAENKAVQEKAAREKAEKEQMAAAEKRVKEKTAQSKNVNDERKQESWKPVAESGSLQGKTANKPANKTVEKMDNDAGTARKEAANAAVPMPDKKKDAPKLPEQKKEAPYKGSSTFTKVNKEKERFQELLRDESFIYYMDTQSIRYIPIPNRQEKMIDVWVKLKPNSFSDDGDAKAGKYYLEHYYLNPKSKQIQFLCELEVTGRPSNAIKERPYSSQNWENLVPGSVEDDIYHAVVKKAKSSSSIGGVAMPSASDVLDMLNIGL